MFPSKLQAILTVSKLNVKKRYMLAVFNQLINIKCHLFKKSSELECFEILLFRSSTAHAYILHKSEPQKKCLNKDGFVVVVMRISRCGMFWTVAQL